MRERETSPRGDISNNGPDNRIPSLSLSPTSPDKTSRQEKSDLTGIAIFYLVDGGCIGKLFTHSNQAERTIAAAVFTMSFIVAAMVKNWLWMENHRNALSRDVKQLEDQVAQLTEILLEREIRETSQDG